MSSLTKLLIEKLEKLTGKKVILEANFSKTDRHIVYQGSDMNTWKLGDTLMDDSDTPVKFQGLILNRGVAHVQENGVTVSKKHGAREDTVHLSYDELTSIMRNLLT